MIHQRNQAQIFVRSFSYTSTLFKVTSEGLQSKGTILKIYQRECLAAILKVRIFYLGNMKFTSSTFIFRGGLLGNKWFCRALSDSIKSTRLCRLCFILPTVQVVSTDGYGSTVSTVILLIVLVLLLIRYVRVIYVSYIV